MKKLLSMFCAAAVAITGVSATASAVSAAPTITRSAPVFDTGSNLIEVQNRRDRRSVHRRGFYRQNNHAYYNGHRGYRERRPGYRQRNGYWFPAGAFIAGAIIGSTTANASANRLPAAHVNWCQNRYRSYRVYDNSFQPYNGPRLQCASPYAR